MTLVMIEEHDISRFASAPVSDQEGFQACRWHASVPQKCLSSWRTGAFCCVYHSSCRHSPMPCMVHVCQVAGILFARQAQLKVGQEDDSRTEPAGKAFKPTLGIHLETGAVQRLGQAQLSQAAIWAFRLAAAQFERPPCSLLHTLCSVSAQHSGLLQRQSAGAQHVRAAQEDLQRCFAHMREYDCSS